MKTRESLQPTKPKAIRQTLLGGIAPQPIFAVALLLAACGGSNPPPAMPAPTAASSEPAAPPAAPAASYKSDFKTSPPEKWTSVFGNWWVKDGVYQQDDANLEGARTMLTLPESDCYTYQVRTRKMAGHEAFGLLFKYQGKHVWWGFGEWDGSSLSGIDKPQETRRKIEIEPERWYLVKVIVHKDQATGWLDDAQLWSIRRTPEQVQGLKKVSQDLVGFVGLGTWNAHAQFSNVEVTPVCK
jgi:hypothetical protein